MSTALDQSLAQRIGRIEELTRAIEESADSPVRADAQALVHAVLDLHGAGLARILERIEEGDAAGRSLVEELGRDELVGSLFLLHGLHPLDLETRVRQALDTVRPHLRSHGGEVTLLSVDEGVVRLRMEGSCHGCPSSALTLKHSIEEAIASAAPDAAAIEVEGVVEPPAAAPGGFIPVDQLIRETDTVGNDTHKPARIRPLDLATALRPAEAAARALRNL